MNAKQNYSTESPACSCQYYISEQLYCRLLQQVKGEEVSDTILVGDWYTIEDDHRVGTVMIEDGYISERCSVLAISYDAEQCWYVNSSYCSSSNR